MLNPTQPANPLEPHLTRSAGQPADGAAKAYHRPRLRDLGDLRDLTQLGTTNPSADLNTGYSDP
jgi:hypothetical protein